MESNTKLVFIFLVLVLYSCKIADISEPSKLAIIKSEQLANDKLDEVVEIQGFNVMEKQNIYSLKVTDHWQGFLGKMAKLWPDTETTFQSRYNFNTFDGSLLFLTGKKEGDQIGVQTWQFYEKTKGESNFLNKDTGKKHNPLEFGIVVLHYFIELPYRLRNAPIKRYYGQRVQNGKNYDLVFASWGSEASNKKYDQYVVWINTKTKLVEYCIYTLRTNTNIFTRNIYGSIAFLDYKDVQGFKIPTKMPIMLNDGVIAKPNLEKYFHQFTIHDFNFGGFEEIELYPLQNFEKKIDTK